MFRCFTNIQKDANEQKLTQAGRTNVAIYMCTKFAVRFVYVDTNNSVRSWQILYVFHVLWYVNGNAVTHIVYVYTYNMHILMAVAFWCVHRSICSLILM